MAILSSMVLANTLFLSDKDSYEHKQVNDGNVSVATNFYLAKKVFKRTAAYDSAITQYLSNIEMEN